MKIGIYNQTVTYKTGGTESYTAFLLQSIQNMYPYAEITIISEENKSMFEGGGKRCIKSFEFNIWHKY